MAVPPTTPPNSGAAVLREATRLALLRATGLLDSPPDQTFDRLTSLATRLLDVRVATVTLVDADRQFFLSCVGVAEPWATQRGTPLSHSFCQYVVGSGEALVVEDARGHPLVGENLAIRDLGVIAYAGMPLRTSDGIVLGSFCAIDTKPRKWSETDLDTLRTLADSAVAEVELRRSARELAEREARFRGTLENIRALAVTLDPSGRITFVNDYLCNITGYTRDELIGSVWFDRFVPPEDLERRRQLFGTVKRGAITSQNEGFILTKAGERRLIAWDNTLLRGPTEETVGIAGIGRDVTAEREAERMKDELIGLVSHELRAPLTSIRGGLTLMLKHADSLDEKSRKMLTIAQRNGDRLMRLVTDLLDLERIEAGRIPLERTRVSVAQLIADACETTLALADEAAVTLNSTADESIVDVDADRLVQVLTNLVANAIKFSPAGSSVDVSARKAGTDILFSVRDHGRGIPPEQLERIFERFAQVHVDDAKKRGGAGLGLAIARAIVAQHGGRVWAESTLGAGATFLFSIPEVAPNGTTGSSRAALE